MDKASSIGLLGSVSGTVIALILQPLENIKMALMIPPKDLPLGRNVFVNMYRAQRYISQNEGLRGFYKGTIPSVLRAGVGSFFFFGSLRHLERLLSEATDSPIKNFACSSIARIISSVVSNPINVIETRFEMTNFKQYSSILDGVKKIWQKEGPSTFMTGGLTSCFKEGMFAGMYYMLYNGFKDYGFSKLSAGLLSGLLSTSFSHPFEIVRAKLQTHGVRDVKHKESLLEEFKYMARHGGWFKGLFPRLIKKPLSNGLTFVLFETIE